MISIDKSLLWFVARSKPSQWSKAAKELRDAGFAVYCPMKRVEVYRKRFNVFRTTESPVMTGYMFVGMRRDAMHFGRIRDDCSAVGGLLGINGNPGMVPSFEVEKIWLAEIDMQFDDTRAARIHRKEEARTRKATLEMKFGKGKAVDVTDGPFAGISAVVDEVTSKGNIKALVNLFGGLSIVEFEASQLSTAA